MKVHIVFMYGNVMAVCDNTGDVAKISKELIDSEGCDENHIEIQTVEMNSIIEG